MGTVNPFFGNLIINVLMVSDGTFPTALVAFNGSTGNCIAFQCLEEKKTTDDIKSTKTTYKTNDNKVYATSQEQEGETKGALLSRAKKFNEWLSTVALSAQQNGQKMLQIQNLNFVDGQWQETFCLGDLLAQRITHDGDAGSNQYELTKTPPSAALSITTTNIAAIASTLSVTIRATGAVSIPTTAQDVMVYT